MKKIKIDPKKMGHIEIGAGGSRRLQYIFCGVIILILLITKLLFASGLTLDETKKQLGGDPYKIAKWMGENIKGTEESIQYTQPAERLFKYRKGDCEDWATLSRYFIGDKYETHLVVWSAYFREDSRYYKKSKKRKIFHCVVAIKIAKDNWGIIDNDRFIQYGKTLADIVKINCDLRRVIVIKAFIADLRKLRYKIIKYIDLEK